MAVPVFAPTPPGRFLPLEHNDNDQHYGERNDHGKADLAGYEASSSDHKACIKKQDQPSLPGGGQTPAPTVPFGIEPELVIFIGHFPNLPPERGVSQRLLA